MSNSNTSRKMQKQKIKFNCYYWDIPNVKGIEDGIKQL